MDFVRVGVGKYFYIYSRLGTCLGAIVRIFLGMFCWVDIVVC